MALREFIGDGKTERAPEKRQVVRGVRGFLRCTSVKSDWWTGLKSPHQQKSSPSETNTGAAGPSGLRAPRWKSSTGSSSSDSIPASERYSKTLLISSSFHTKVCLLVVSSTQPVKTVVE